MEARQFDTLARVLAAGSSRRSVLARLAAGLGGSSFALAGPARALAQGDDDEDERGPACREEGHPCEGNQDCCDGLECLASGPGAAERCTRREECPDCPEIELTTEIVAARAFRLEVDCAFDEETDLTTCECSAVGGEGDEAATGIVVSAAATCAQVVGREVEFVSGSGFGIAGYAAEGATLTLVLAGNVTANGAAVHWCRAGEAFVPAVGPNLVEAGDDVSDDTGAIVVVGGSCGELRGNPDEINWYARCAEPAADLELSLTGTGDGVSTEIGTRRTNEAGRLRFRRVAPGAYRLEPAGDGWCRAECDNLSETGEIVVEAGRRTHVWVFACGG